MLYPCGYNIIAYNLDKKIQKFLPLHTNDTYTSNDISAIAVSSLKNTNAKNKVLAVAERGENSKASVSVFDVTTFKRKGKSAISSSEVSDTKQTTYTCTL